MFRFQIRQGNWRLLTTRVNGQFNSALRPQCAYSTSQSASSSSSTPASSSSVSAASSSASSISLNSPRTALIFPGQGSQRVGAPVKELENEWPAIVRPVFEEMDETLKLRLSNTMKHGLTSEIQSTELAQPAILAYSIAVSRVLLSHLGLKSCRELGCVAMGHSLGEYTALVATESLSFANAIRLVHARGTAMKAATRPGNSGMLALVSLPNQPLHLPSIQQLLREAETRTGQPVDVANFNSPFQIVISGHREALERIKHRVQTKDREPDSEALTTNKSNSAATPSSTSSSSSSSSPTRGILRAIPLDVSGAFHSRLMAPALQTFKEHLSRTTFATPTLPIIFNVHAQPSIKVERFPEYLTSQLVSPVQWQQSLLTAIRKFNVQSFLEMGPSTPLSNMLRSTIQQHARYMAANPHPLDPSLHPDDVASGRVMARPISPESLAKSFMAPKIQLSDGQSIDENDVAAALAGVHVAWQDVKTHGLSTHEEIKVYLREK